MVRRRVIEGSQRKGMEIPLGNLPTGGPPVKEDEVMESLNPPNEYVRMRVLHRLLEEAAVRGIETTLRFARAEERGASSMVVRAQAERREFERESTLPGARAP